MSYLDIFIKGTCEEMCPQKELKIRESEGLLHVLEHATPQPRPPGTTSKGSRRPRADPRRVVKAYSRSAAGQAAPRPADLRTLTALTSTVSYLLDLAYDTPAPGLTAGVDALPCWRVLEFVSDRLRAVRQDLVMQGMADNRALSLLEASAAFHVYAAYRLTGTSQLDQFDPVMNAELLKDCIQRCLALYDSGAASENSATIEAIAATLQGCESPGPLVRLFKMPNGLRCDVREPAALEFLVAAHCGNVVRALRLIPDLSLPLACAAASALLPPLRRRSWKMLCSSFSSPPAAQLATSSDLVARWLAVPSCSVALSIAKEAGLQTTTGTQGHSTIIFSKQAAATVPKMDFCQLNCIEDRFVKCDLKKEFLVQL